MIYTDYPLNDSVTPPTYLGTPRKYGFIDKQTPIDDATLQRIKQDCGLQMNVSLLRLCLAYLQKQSTPTSMEVLYLLDSLSIVYSCRPETQTLAGLDTDDPDHANALSALVCRCRASHKLTPPLTLRTVLDGIHAALAPLAPKRIHDADPAVHFRLCTHDAAAALPLQGYTPLAALEIGNTPWKLVCHAPHVENTARHTRRNDTLLLLHGAGLTPSAAECAAAQTLFAEIDSDKLIRTLPVDPQMLLPTALTCATGLTINCAAFAKPDASTFYPCDLLQSTPGGWLLIAPTEAVQSLQEQCTTCGLTLLPFATARSDRYLEFEPRYQGQQLRISRNLIDSVTISYAYRLSETHTAPSATIEPLLVPTCLAKSGFGGCADLISGEGFPAWFARTCLLPMDAGFDADAISRALSLLRGALQTDGCPALGNASLAIGLEITPTLSRTVLWQYVLRLFHTLRQNALPCLPISLCHKQSGKSQMTLTMLCRKPFDHKRSESVSASLPLPFCSSASHTDHPEVLIAYTADVGSITGMADVLCRAGGKVQTLHLTPCEEGCNVLADAVDHTRLLLLVGSDEQIADIPRHPRVQKALQSLMARDGLCLAQGGAMAALCRAELFPQPLASMPMQAPTDTCSGAFSHPVSSVQNLSEPTIPPVLRMLPPCLPCLDGNPCPDDPLLSPFRSLQGHPILAMTQNDQGAPLACRLRGMEGHLIAFADGFDATQLQAALDYCR